MSDSEGKKSSAGLVGAVITVLALAAIAILRALTAHRRKRIFISFAVEDVRYRDFLAQQAKDERSPFEFVDYSVREPFDSKWKTQCRARIKECDGVIALLSTKTWNADGARWEMKCAIEEGIPIAGIHVHAKNKGAIPPELKGHKVMTWSWTNVKKFVDSV